MNRKLTKEAQRAIETDPFFQKCARADEGNCGGKITIEHAIQYAGKRIDDTWSLIPLCEYHHSLGEWFNSGGGLDKEKNRQIALSRAPQEARAKYPRLFE